MLATGETRYSSILKSNLSNLPNLVQREIVSALKFWMNSDSSIQSNLDAWLAMLAIAGGRPTTWEEDSKF